MNENLNDRPLPDFAEFLKRRGVIYEAAREYGVEVEMLNTGLMVNGFRLWRAGKERRSPDFPIGALSLTELRQQVCAAAVDLLSD